ncbi:hypothetical protein ACKKBG_A07670 [Auxenochlorella protothecoides x Auxenochlorella symbiontica]
MSAGSLLSAQHNISPCHKEGRSWCLRKGGSSGGRPSHARPWIRIHGPWSAATWQQWPKLSCAAKGATRCRATGGSRDEGSAPCPARHLSTLASQDLLFLVLKMDIARQQRRALIEGAGPSLARFLKLLREQEAEVDQAIEKIQAAKAEASAARRPLSPGGLDPARRLRLTLDLAEAARAEDFKEAERLKAELAAAGGERAPPPPAFHLGQLVCEQGRGYMGVVAGWEQVCGEGPAWLAAAGHDRAGAPGPWYFLLVEEVAGRGPRSGLPPVALVPEGALEPAGDPSLVPGGAHPLLSLLFLGKDAEGNHLPCRQLRQRFGAERRDVHPPGSDDEEGDADGGTRLEDEEGIPQDPGNRPSGRKTLPGIDMSSLDDTGGDL